VRRRRAVYKGRLDTLGWAVVQEASGKIDLPHSHPVIELLIIHKPDLAIIARLAVGRTHGTWRVVRCEGLSH